MEVVATREGAGKVWGGEGSDGGGVLEGLVEESVSGAGGALKRAMKRFWIALAAAPETFWGC